MNVGSQPAPQLHVVLTSGPTCVRQAAAGVRSALASLGCSEAALAEVELCAVEAMNNVIEHGYRSRTGLPFELKLWCGQDGLVIEIRDEGEPIPVKSLAMATLPTVDIEKVYELPDRGWGLGILRALMDEVSYEARPGGNLLRLVRRRLLTGPEAQP